MIRAEVVRPVEGQVRFRIVGAGFDSKWAIRKALKSNHIQFLYSKDVFHVSRGRYTDLISVLRHLSWIDEVKAWEYFNETVHCDQRCQNAKSDVSHCICSCMGEGHGGAEKYDADDNIVVNESLRIRSWWRLRRAA